MATTLRHYLGHDDVIGSRVQKGHYDLVGMYGETIALKDRHKEVKPDMEVTMRMQSMPEPALETGSPEERRSIENEAAVKGPRFKALGRFLEIRANNLNSRES